MNWKLKALAQSALSTLPHATTLNYWGQKFITRAHNNLAGSVSNRLDKARWFVQQFAEHHVGELGDAQFYEFGAGWDLAGPLALYCLGANRQILVDLARCARLELVNGVIGELNRLDEAVARRPGEPLASLADLDRRFGISYRAPSDARSTGLPQASVDCITSTYTLEHIPANDIRRILAECARILKPRGLMISLIDYQDHYSWLDTRISRYNFLQYSERQWRWFNSSLHYQNRMRHSQYRRLFADAGLTAVSEELAQPSESDLEWFKSIRMSSDFHGLDAEDLTILGSRIISRVRTSRVGTADAPQQPAPGGPATRALGAPS